MKITGKNRFYNYFYYFLTNELIYIFIFSINVNKVWLRTNQKIKYNEA